MNGHDATKSRHFLGDSHRLQPPGGCRPPREKKDRPEDRQAPCLKKKQKHTEVDQARPTQSARCTSLGGFRLAPGNKDLCPRLTNVHVNWPFRCHLQQQLGSQLSSGFCRGLISPWMGESLNINRTRHREARAMEDSTRRQGQSAGTPWLSPSLPATHWVQNRGMPGKGFRLPSPTHPIHTPHFPNA